MSEPPPSNDDDPSKKGKRKNLNTYAQKGLGSFGIKRSKKIVHRGEVEVVPLKVATTVSGPTAADTRYTCKHCGGIFKNAQGLGSHQLSCQKAVLALQQSAAACGMVLAVSKNLPPGSKCIYVFCSSRLH
jgi:hypothetical protein